jgi:hypothetical protein
VSTSYCGIDCSVCTWREPQNCRTCKEYKGDIWHGVCAVAKCCIGKGLEDCGHCGEFPCQLLKEFAFDEMHGDGGERLANLCKEHPLTQPACNSCCMAKCVKSNG